jgi:hypothetical protein
MRLILLASAAIVLAQAADPALSARLDTGNPAGLVAPGGEAAVALVIANAGGQAAQVTVDGTMQEFDGGSSPLSGGGTVAPGGELRVVLPVDGGRRGIRYVSWTLHAAGQEVPGSGRFVYARPAGPGQDPAGFRYSVCSHPSRAPLPDAAREMAAAGQIGIGTMRWSVEWGGLEPEPGRWDWQRFDERLALAEQNGLQTQALLAFCAQHAATPATMALYQQARAAGRKDAWLIWSRHAPDDAAWRRYVAAVVGRYKQRVALWEVWNEPDLDGFFSGSTDEYIRMLRSAYAEAKRADPGCTVMSGGFATVTKHPGRKLNPDLEQRVLVEASDAFDIHAHHEHGTFPGFAQAVEELERMRARMPVVKPLYFNETAMHSAFGTEHAQALTLVKKLTYARVHGAIGYTWYDLRNDGTDPADHEHNYGLLTRDFQPKAAYAVYNELIARMRGTRYSGSLDLGSGRHAYVFAGGGRRLVVTWNEEPGLPDQPVAVVAPGCAGGSVIDLMGNAAPLPARGGALVISTRDEPTYIELPGGEAMPQVVGPLIAVEGVTLVAAGEIPDLHARLRNPLDTPMAMLLSWRGLPVQRRVELAARATATVALDGAQPEPSADGRQAQLHLAYEVDGGPWQGTIAVPLQLVQRIPFGDPAVRPADWTLDTPAQVVDFCTADPSLSAQTWKGPADQSAAVWLARGAGELRIRVVVQDNIHHQGEAADAAWRGDGLQIGLQVPGQEGFLEVGAAMHDDGRMLRTVWTVPVGMRASADDLGVRIVRVGEQTTYEVTLPYAAFGLSDAILSSGLRFNLIVNDNDGPLRKGFIRIAPGIGERKDAATFPVIRFDPAPR